MGRPSGGSDKATGPQEGDWKIRGVVSRGREREEPCTSKGTKDKRRVNSTKFFPYQMGGTSRLGKEKCRAKPNLRKSSV